jgi:hypothetical protein
MVLNLVWYKFNTHAILSVLYPSLSELLSPESDSLINRSASANRIIFSLIFGNIIKQMAHHAMGNMAWSATDKAIQHPMLVFGLW